MPKGINIISEINKTIPKAQPFLEIYFIKISRNNDSRSSVSVGVYIFGTEVTKEYIFPLSWVQVMRYFLTPLEGDPCCWADATKLKEERATSACTSS